MLSLQLAAVLHRVWLESGHGIPHGTRGGFGTVQNASSCCGAVQWGDLDAQKKRLSS